MGSDPFDRFAFTNRLFAQHLGLYNRRSFRSAQQHTMGTIVQKRAFDAEHWDELSLPIVTAEPDTIAKFVMLHQPLVHHLSKWLQRSYAVDADDAGQIGMIGLIEAARRFDPKRGVQFSTYANYWIRHACQRYGAQAALFIHLPIRIAESLFLVQRDLDKLASKFGPAFAKEELDRRCTADAMFSGQWRVFMQALNVRSLSDRRETEYRQAQKLVAPEFKPLDQQLSAERAATVRAAIDRLRPRERRFVRLRHGIDSAPHTLAQIGRRAGLTRERVRQILKRAEERLRRWLSRELDIPMPVAAPNEAAAESISDSAVEGCEV